MIINLLEMNYMTDKVFVDTNLWVYLYSGDDNLKGARVKEIIDLRFGDIIISTQVLGELYNILTKKKFKSKNESKDIIIETSSFFNFYEIELLTILKAIDININFGYSYWDSMIISSAINENCSILYSEDMQHQQLIENLKIINPFADLQ